MDCCIHTNVAGCGNRIQRDSSWPCQGTTGISLLPSSASPPIYSYSLSRGVWGEEPFLMQEEISGTEIIRRKRKKTNMSQH